MFVMGHVRIQERALLVADTGVWLVYSRQRTTMLINNLQLSVWHPSAENHPPPTAGVIRLKNDAQTLMFWYYGLFNTS